MRTVFGVTPWSMSLGVVVALVATLWFGVAPAVAGIGGSDTPTWPQTATVGDLINASVLITNTSSTPNNTENVQMTALFVTPACADGSLSICLSPNLDPGIFKVLSATGDAGTLPCANLPFTLGATNPTTGEVQLTPSATVTLGSVSSGTNLSCQVNILLRVFQMPTNPVGGAPGVTDPLTRATLVGASSGLGGTAGGAAQITISKATPGVATTSNPTGGNVVPGTSVTDTVIVTKAPGAVLPTGNVRFILCQPNAVNATGCPSGSGDVIGADKVLVGNTATSDATTNTNTSGKYCWRARYLGDANYNPSNHTDPDSECFTTQSPCQISVDKTCSVGGGPDIQDCVVPVGGALVTYKYAVSNTGNSDVTSGTITDMVGQTVVAGPIPFTLAAGQSQTFSSQRTVTENTTNVVTVIGNPGPNQCQATDQAVVITPCDIKYPFASANPLTSVDFNESEVLRAFEPNFAGPGGRIKLFYNDEHTLSLGVRSISVKDASGTVVTNRQVTPMVAAVGPPEVTCLAKPNPNGFTICHAVNPLVGFKGVSGDLAGTDPTGRPIFPSIFITDLTINGADSLAGDWQFGGSPIPPSDVYGTWKSATKLVDKTKNPTAITITVDADSAKNNWVIGASGQTPEFNPPADTPAGGFAALTNQGFGAEVSWNVDDLRINLATGTGSRNPNDPPLSSLSGHAFRIQFMIHDGDQNKSGGDVGQNCMTVAIP